MARRIAVINCKGGVGKTTTAVNLATVLTTRGHRVLLLDYDSQSSASHSLGLTSRLLEARLDPVKPLYTAADFTLGIGKFSPIAISNVPSLHILPATHRLAYLERDLLDDVLAGTRRLAQAVATIDKDYDYIIADCPPSIGMIAINAMVACPELIVPIDLAPLSIPGALDLRDYLGSLRDQTVPQLRIMGVLATFYSEAAKQPRELYNALRDIFGALLFKTYIHTSQALRSSAGTGTPMVLLEPSSRATAEYIKFTDEVVARAI